MKNEPWKELSITLFHPKNRLFIFRTSSCLISLQLSIKKFSKKECFLIIAQSV